MQKKIAILNGVNLDLLGSREPEIYGTETLADIESAVRERMPVLAKLIDDKIKLDIKFVQTNSELEFLNQISGEFDGIVMNPAAWSHTSLAIADRVAAVKTPVVEVHLSNLSAREREDSLAAPHCIGVVYGFGLKSYLAGSYALLEHLLT